ncbi:MAG: hypothetical protein CVU34_10460 [Betaproteobacteria bacterium HGW-Betaproteobacteria-7]|jgi:hypothetical protein|nr:MAG: hypothetical protein CVU34_10460 [Betaproteobacteria bacterium HGW-Betaproteobacteria-7]
MKPNPAFIRLGLAIALLGSLTACTVVPAHPQGYYAGPPVVVETYPVYRYGYGYPQRHYNHDRRDYRGHEQHGGRNYRDGGRRHDSPFDSAARTHRDIRRSLGLPRLPGMP